MKRDQQGEPDAEHDERNQEVAVGEDRAKFFEFSHGDVGWCASNWRNHKEASGGMSTGGDGEDCQLTHAY